MTLFTPAPQIAQDAKQHALEKYPRNSTGCVIDGKYVPIEKLYEIEVPVMQGVIHSRMSTTLKTPAPSRPDMRNQQHMATPWAVFHCNGTTCSELQWFGDQLPIPPLLGRKFVSGWTDCWCLVRDVYREQFGILLENVPRNGDWSQGEHPEDYFSPENIERTGFKIISPDDARPGDVLLGRVKSRVNNHCALLLENDQVLQQFAGEGYVSCVESITQWSKLVTYVGRHKSFVADPDSIPPIRIT